MIGQHLIKSTKLITLISFQSSMENAVHELEKKWAQVQENALKQPSPGIISFFFVKIDFSKEKIKV